MAQPRHRPLRLFPDARRLIIPGDRETCLHCGQPLLHRNTWYVKTYVQTLDGPVFVAGKRHRCHNPSCSHPGATYYASGVLSISLPHCTSGLEVLAFIGWQHDHHHRQFVEIQSDVHQRGLLINERTVGKLYRQFLALLGGMTPPQQPRLEMAAQQHGGRIWAGDARQPAGRDPPLYVLSARLSNTPISALQDSNPTAERLRAWLAPYPQLPFAVLATRADGEKAVVAALKASWSDAPQQRGQLHFLNNIAKPALEVDGRLRQHLRNELGDLAAVPEERQCARPAPADDDLAPPLGLSSAMPA